MHLREESLRSQIAIGWATALIVLAIMLENMILESIFKDNNFKALRYDPGVNGMKMMLFVLGLYALMPMLVSLANNLSTRIVRWLAVAVTALMFLFFAFHHLAHWYYGERPSPSSHVLDVSHHLLMLWVLVNSIRWARFNPNQSA